MGTTNDPDGMLFANPLAMLLLSGLDQNYVAVLARAFASADSSAARSEALEAALRLGGTSWRHEIGNWISHIVPVEMLVPAEYGRWRRLVQDALQFFFSHLSDRRLATKLVEQIELPFETPSETRLLQLISRTPGLQKLGQVLARNRHLAPALRSALIELENGMTDMEPDEIRAVIAGQLGPRLEAFGVIIEPAIYREGSAAAVVRFTWKPRPSQAPEPGVFKVLKPYVPACFGEDMTLLQRLGEFLAHADRKYGFVVRDVKEILSEVRLLLERELDFEREQSSLVSAARLYRSSIGIRVPRLIAPLCTPLVTAMSDEPGVKATEAFPLAPLRRKRVAEQLVEALLGVPLMSGEADAIFHADPHAGNLFYNEPARELVLLDWALAEPMSLELRRQTALLALMMILRNVDGVRAAIHALSRMDGRASGKGERLIDATLDAYFDQLAPEYSPGTLDALSLVDQIALEGVHFPAQLLMLRKIVFTLDGVLFDVTRGEVRIDQVITSEFLTRWIASFGGFHAPLTLKDLASVQWNALLYPFKAWARKRLPPSRPEVSAPTLGVVEASP
jgi:ubiquinone biosynthesis protein